MCQFGKGRQRQNCFKEHYFFFLLLYTDIIICLYITILLWSNIATSVPVMSNLLKRSTSQGLGNYIAMRKNHVNLHNTLSEMNLELSGSINKQ